MTPARQVLLIAVVAFFAMMGVAQHARGVHLGLHVTRLDAERERLAKDNRELLCDINALAHPTRIAERAEGLTVDLMDPVQLTKAPLTEVKAAPAGPAGNKRR